MYDHFTVFCIRQFYVILFFLSTNAFCFLLIKFTLAKSWPAHSDGSHLLHNLSCGVNLLHIQELYCKPQQGYPRRPCRQNLTGWGTLDSRTEVSSTAQPSPTIPGCIFRHPLTLACTFCSTTGRITGARGSLRAPNIPAPQLLFHCKANWDAVT